MGHNQVMGAEKIKLNRNRRYVAAKAPPAVWQPRKDAFDRHVFRGLRIRYGIHINVMAAAAGITNTRLLRYERPLTHRTKLEIQSEPTIEAAIQPALVALIRERCIQQLAVLARRGDVERLAKLVAVREIQDAIEDEKSKQEAEEWLNRHE